MREAKLFVIPLVFFFFLFYPLTGLLYAEENLIKNGDFEQFTGDFLSEWIPNTYSEDPESVAFYVEHDSPHSGKTCVTIENFTKTDSLINQTVEVSPDTVYKLSGWIKAEGIDSYSTGANISILDTFVNSAEFKNTNRSWQYTEILGRTGPGQHQIIVAIRLGGYTHLSSGKASFDNVQLVKILHPPENAQIFNFNRIDTENNSGIQSAKTAPVHTYPWVTGYMAVYLLFFLLGYRFFMKPNKPDQVPDQRLALVVVLLLLSAFVLRLLLAPVVEGYPYDLECFKDWSTLAADKGLPGFYADGTPANYPPGYIYILYVLGLIRKLFALHPGSTVFLILLKIPSFITDILAAFLIYRLGCRYIKSVNASVFLAFLYCFNPAIMHNSAFFGQVDSVFTLFILVSLLFVERKNIPIAAVFYTVAVLIKPQALILGPVVALILFETKSWQTIMTSILAMTGTFILLILPFSIHQSNPFWIIDFYLKTLDSYNFTTINAFNLYALLGANVVELSQEFLFISFKIWGHFFLILVLGVASFFYIRNFQIQKRKTWLYFIALFLITAFFVLVYKMHERYLYPALMLSILCFIMIKDKRFLFVFMGLSVTLLFNQAAVLELAANYNQTMITPDHPLEYNLMRIIGAINLGLLIYLVKIGYDIYLEKKIYAGSSFRLMD